MRTAALLCLLAGLLSAGDDRRPVPVKDKALQKRIHAAIDHGVEYLKAVQHEEGYWPGPIRGDVERMGDDLTYIGGRTALALYAMSASGVPREDFAMLRGIQWLLAHPNAYRADGATATYTISLVILAFTRIEPKLYRTLIHECADKLVAGQQSSGMWTYVTGSVRTGPPARAPDRAAWRKGGGISGPVDNSNTQFAALALWAAESMAGYPTPKKVWERLKKHFTKRQLPDGGWAYRKTDQSTSLTMTAAGAVTLVYAHAALDAAPDALVKARRLRAVQRGVKRIGLDRKYRAYGASWQNYYLIYSIERVGTVVGLDPYVWYPPGAKYLVEQQDKDGHWPASRAGGPKGGRPSPFGGARPARMPRRPAASWDYETSLALLFLTRVTLPPIRGAVTERGEMRTGPITQTETFPDVTKELDRAFGHYHAYKPDARAKVIGEFGKAGPLAVRLFLDKLAGKDAAERATAYELLSKLVTRPFLFDPQADAEARAIMLVPIESWWREHGAKLKWDGARFR